MKRWVWLLALVATGCPKSGSTPDAGTRIHRSTDLRTAMMQSFPEFRGARVVTARARLIRQLDRPVPIEAAIEVMKKNEFTVHREGPDSVTAVRPPYTLELRGSKLEIWLPLLDADVAKMLGAPTAMTTEQLALWFPKVPDAVVTDERFRLDVKYEATESRAQYLAWQMVDLNTQSSWRVTKWPEGYERVRRPDGGGGGTPDDYSIELFDENTAGRIALHRQGPNVDFGYELVTEERR